MKKIFWIGKKVCTVLKDKIHSADFRSVVRITVKDFTRNRKLTFDSMIILLLQKWMKSLQLRLNEFFSQLQKVKDTATVSAFSLARKKINHIWFIMLSEACLKLFYDLKENNIGYKTWKWLRLLAIDGSKIILPDTKETREYFGEIRVKNQYGEQGTYVGWVLSTAYDPLNNIVVDALFENGKSDERKLALQHIGNIGTKWEDSVTGREKIKNIFLFDRWYFSRLNFAVMLLRNEDFVFRLPRKSFKEADELFRKDETRTSLLMSFSLDKNELQEITKNEGTVNGEIVHEAFPNNFTVRLAKVLLDTGEIEVLATSLMDEAIYPDSIFKELYFKRWGIEGYYNLLKNRLWLENFSGESVESIKQDLYSAIFLSNLESILSAEANYELEEKCRIKGNKNQQIVNKSVSLNVVKNSVFELFLSNKSIDIIFDNMRHIFKLNPTQKREWQKKTRVRPRWNKVANFLKRKKKQVF